MAMEAVALLRITLEKLRSSLDTHEDDNVKDALRGDDGQPFVAVALDDATLIHTHAAFSSEPEELAARVHALLGGLLASHDDARGIYVLPDVAEPQSRSYDGVIEELGEVGFWAPLPRTAAAGDQLPAEAGSFDASVRDLLAAMPEGAAGEIERAVASGDYAALEQISKKVEAAMGGRERVVETLQQGDIEGAAEQAMAHVRRMMGAAADADAPEQLDLSKLPFAIPSEEDAPELWAHARKQAAVLMQNPEQLAALGRHLGLPVDAMLANLVPGAASAEPDEAGRPDEADANEGGKEDADEEA